jgi:hypothetical protein
VEAWWKEPPPAVHFQDARKGRPTFRTRELDEFSELLKQHPGRWALVEVRPSSGGGYKYKRRGIEVTSRKRPDGMFDIYVRAPQ